MEDVLFKILPDLPHPPSWMVDNIDLRYRPKMEKFKTEDQEFLKIDTLDQWKDQEYNWIKPMSSNGNLRYRFNQKDEDWVTENITTKFEANNSGVMFFDTPQLPHTDTTRHYVLLYNIETGGPDATLSFWREKGKDVNRERNLAVDRGEHLELIKQIHGPENCWYLFNTQVLHSVEGMEGRRTNLQISFNEEPDFR